MKVTRREHVCKGSRRTGHCNVDRLRIRERDSVFAIMIIKIAETKSSSLNANPLHKQEEEALAEF